MAERVAIARKTYGALHDELARLGADLMVRTLAALERGTMVERPQTAEGVTYAKKVEKSEARIFWSEPAHVVDCQIRALSPWPGAWTEMPTRNGPERVKILDCQLIDRVGPPGGILSVTDEIVIACGEGAIRATRLQRAGGKVLDAGTFLRGFALLRGAKVL